MNDSWSTKRDFQPSSLVACAEVSDQTNRINTGNCQPSGRISETVKKIYILSKSHNLREKMKYVLYSKQENQSGEGREGVGLDEKGFGIQTKKNIELNKSLTRVTL